MGKSPRYVSLKRKTIVYGLISTLMWVITGLVFIVLCLAKFKQKDASGTPILSNELKSIVASIGVTALIGLAVAIIIKDKIRTAIYMASLILATIVYKEVGMYIVLGIWFVDEYVIHALYKKNKRKLEIRKEIDLE